MVLFRCEYLTNLFVNLYSKKNILKNTLHAWTYNGPHNFDKNQDKKVY